LDQPEAAQQPKKLLVAPTVEGLAKLYKHLTGKEMSPEELERGRAILAKADIPPKR